MREKKKLLHPNSCVIHLFIISETKRKKILKQVQMAEKIPQRVYQFSRFYE